MRPKKKICISCNTEQYIFSRKRCKTCARIEDYKPLKKTAPKKTFKKKENSQELDEFFMWHLERATHSEESGIPLPPTRANICHILPKSSHKSVASNKDNCIYLTLDEHTKFDNLLFKHKIEELSKEFPKVFPKVCQKLKILLDLSTENTPLKTTLKKYLEK